jgi:hypothetical protein
MGKNVQLLNAVSHIWGTNVTTRVWRWKCAVTKQYDQKTSVNLSELKNKQEICFKARKTLKAISNAYSQYVFVALDIKYVVRTRHIVFCGLSDSVI